MDIRNLDILERELICDAIKIATSPDVIKVNDRFWHMEDTMQEIMEEIMAGKSLTKSGCDHEAWGLICDAIEIAISPEVISEINDLFWNKTMMMECLVSDIEQQSGCQTKED